MRQFMPAGLLLGLFAVGSTACTIDVHGDMAVAREEKRFTVTGDPELNLRTFDGRIELSSWDQKDVRVEIERRGPDSQSAAGLTVNIRQEGNRIVIEAPKPARHAAIHFGNEPSVSLIVTAPRRMKVEARTGDGSIRVNGVEGPVNVHTGDGSIQVRDSMGALNAQTGDGSIDAAGRFNALTVRTGDGSVNIDLDQGSALSVDSSISTGDGSVSLRLPAAFDAEIDAHSGDGRISARGLVETTPERRRDRNSLRARVGNGGRELRLRSGDGSISISR
jgi:DUF4097 and DUF4098 domain-containing protein YvlB